jgi:hypothetical protein
LVSACFFLFSLSFFARAAEPNILFEEGSKEFVVVKILVSGEVDPGEQLVSELVSELGS